MQSNYTITFRYYYYIVILLLLLHSNSSNYKGNDYDNVTHVTYYYTLKLDEFVYIYSLAYSFMCIYILVVNVPI